MVARNVREPDRERISQWIRRSERVSNIHQMLRSSEPERLSFQLMQLMRWLNSRTYVSGVAPSSLPETQSEVLKPDRDQSLSKIGPKVKYPKTRAARI